MNPLRRDNDTKIQQWFKDLIKKTKEFPFYMIFWTFLLSYVFEFYGRYERIHTRNQ